MDINFELKKDYRKLDSQEIIDDVLFVSKKLNKTNLLLRDYLREGRFSSKAIANHFGTWNNLLLAANLPVNKMNYHLSRLDIFEIVERLWVQKGSQPTLREFELSGHTKKIIISNFGTWMNCLKEFVQYKSSSNEHLFQKELNFKHKTKREPALSLRYDVLKRDNFKCVICGRSPANDSSIVLHVDHIVPYSKGGETELDNLQTLCQYCNLGKSSK